MLVIVGVRLSQMNQDADNHQDGASQHPRAADALAQHDGEQRADERCKGKDGACTGCTERALGQQVEAQAQAISRRADQQKAERRPH
jgi:hypothetical protein